jgi:hypothetical protein
MPTSEFETALTERIEFAVFVAYEQWVRASNYVSVNPYDVLARLLPALPESLTQAAASRGGWGAFDPVNGLPTDEARLLISEMAAQVAKARIAAMAADAPQADQLATVIVDAINRSVTAFVEDPESWRLALGPGERAPVAALGEGVGGPSGEGIDPPAHDVVPPAPEMVDAGGDYGASTSRLVQTVESIGRAEFFQLLGVGDLWFIRGAGSQSLTEAARAMLGVRVEFNPIDDALGGGGVPSPEPGRDAGEAGGGNSPDFPSLPVDPPVGGNEPIDPRYGLPADVAAVIDQWFELLSKAKFYRVQEDGSIYRLNESEAQSIVETLIDVLVRRAQLDLALPVLPTHAEPTQAAASPPAQSPTDAAPAHDNPAAAGLGSDTLQLPPALPAASSSETEVAVIVPDPTSDPVPDVVAASNPADVMPVILPPIGPSTTDPWHA